MACPTFKLSYQERSCSSNPSLEIFDSNHQAEPAECEYRLNHISYITYHRAVHSLADTDTQMTLVASEELGIADTDID